MLETFPAGKDFFCKTYLHPFTKYLFTFARSISCTLHVKMIKWDIQDLLVLHVHLHIKYIQMQMAYMCMSFALGISMFQRPSINFNLVNPVNIFLLTSQRHTISPILPSAWNKWFTMHKPKTMSYFIITCVDILLTILLFMCSVHLNNFDKINVTVSCKKK